MEQLSVWTSVILAVILAGDALMSVRPPRFIRACFEGVGFPENWWWTLVVIKMVAVAGLLAGLAVPGIRVAAATGVVVYFSCAVAAHVRARFLGSEFWVNCLGMLLVSVVTAVTAVTAGVVV